MRDYVFKFLIYLRIFLDRLEIPRQYHTFVFMTAIVLHMYSDCPAHMQQLPNAHAAIAAHGQMESLQSGKGPVFVSCFTQMVFGTEFWLMSLSKTLWVSRVLSKSDI